VGYEPVSGDHPDGLRPRPIYQIDLLALEQRSGPAMVEIIRARGIHHPPITAPASEQLPLALEDDTPLAPARDSSSDWHPDVPALAPARDSAGTHTGQPDPLAPGRASAPDNAPEWQEAAPWHPDVPPAGTQEGQPWHPDVTALAPARDSQDAHAWTHESTDRSDDDGTPRSSGDLIAALRAVLPEVLTDIIGTPHKNGAAPRAFAPPAPLDVPEPAPGRAALPAHPWRLWVAAATDGETEGNWNTLAWLANQHGWHWVGEAILQLANGVGIDSTKKIKVKLDWWRRNQNYGANNRRYEQMLAAEEAPAHPESMLVAVEQAAEAAEEHDALTDTEQYLLDTGFAAMTAQEFRLFDLDAVEQEIERTLSAMDTQHERDQKIGRLVVKWRRQPPVAVAEEPEPDAPAPATDTNDALAEQPAPDEPEAIWHAAQAALRLSIAHGDYARWLQDVAILGLTGEVATLVCPDRGHADHVARHFDGQVRRALADVMGAPVSVQIVARM
jgi:hypothetical protein